MAHGPRAARSQEKNFGRRLHEAHQAATTLKFNFPPLQLLRGSRFGILTASPCLNNSQIDRPQRTTFRLDQPRCPLPPRSVSGSARCKRKSRRTQFQLRWRMRRPFSKGTSKHSLRPYKMGLAEMRQSRVVARARRVIMQQQNSRTTTTEMA